MAETQATTPTTPAAAENTAPEQNTAGQEATTPETAPETYSKEEVEKLIQSAVDRATNKLGNDNKKLRGDLEKERRKNLSEKELKELELQDKEKEIADRERAIAEKENRLIAIKLIKEAGLDDGSDASLGIVDFVMADDEDVIRERVKTFGDLVDKIVKTKVDGVFKASGRTPGVGSDSAANAGGPNSFAAQLGRNTASNNKAAQAVLDHYIGGKK